VAYLAAGQDWPRHKATVIAQEHELGVWLHTQRFRQRRGELDPAKADALDAAAPGMADRKNARQEAQTLDQPSVAPTTCLIELLAELQGKALLANPQSRGGTS
jgi:hypothetical protein